MSLINLIFKKNNRLNTEAYTVLTSDFNLRERGEFEHIGTLEVFREENHFNFHLEKVSIGNFCPPELFKEHDGDYDAVVLVCSREGFCYALWSYAIYKEAIKLIGKTSIFYVDPDSEVDEK